MKKLISLTLALIMCAASLCAFSGCDVKDGATSDDAEKVVLATVGDEKIYLHEFEATYNMYVEYYANYGYDITNDETALKEFKTSLIERMIADKAAIIKAKEAGLDKFTDEQLKEIDESIDTEYKSIEEYYRPLAEEQAGSDDEAAIAAKYEELVEEESQNYTGVKMTYEEYLDYVEETITQNYLINLYKDKIVYKDLNVSEDDIKAKYDEYVESAKQEYAENAVAYKNDQESAELMVTMPTAYSPEGYSRMLSILIPASTEKSETYTENETKMGELEAEYGKLAFEDAVSGKNTNAAKLKEIIAEYNKLKLDNEAEFDKANEANRKKADEAYAALQSGKSFVDVMKEYGEDPDFDSESIFIEKGVLISNQHASENDLSDEVKAEFAKLKIGEYSPVFEDEDGFHIIFYLKDEPVGVRDISELKSFIEDELLATGKTEEWDALVKEWVKDTEFVTINQEILDGVK